MTEGKFTELLGYPDSVVEFGDEWHHKGMVYRSIVLTYLGESWMMTEMSDDWSSEYCEGAPVKVHQVEVVQKKWVPVEPKEKE